MMTIEMRKIAFFAVCLVSFVVYSTAGKFFIQNFLQCNNFMSSANILKKTKNIISESAQNIPIYHTSEVDSETVETSKDI